MARKTTNKKTRPNTMWGGRYALGPAEIMERINASIGFDKKLYAQDIAGSTAHADMLVARGILSTKDGRAIKQGLAQVKAEIERGKTEGPYGAFPAGPLSAEDTKGLIYRVADDRKSVLGAKLAAILEHTHLLVFRPRDAAPAAMQALLDAGWSTNAIVTLSQLVSFLSFQVRSVAGLRTLGASLGQRAATAKAS